MNIERLETLRRVTGVPLVLHGGAGIAKECLMQAVRHGIAKVNIGTATRQPYERLLLHSVTKAQQGVYDAVVKVIREVLGGRGHISHAKVIRNCRF